MGQGDGRRGLGLDPDAGLDGLDSDFDASGRPVGAVSEADQETFAGDPALNASGEVFGEVQSERIKRLRLMTFLAASGWVLAGFFGYGFYRASARWMEWRFPYLLDSNGTVQLVSAWPEDDKVTPYSRNAVLGVVRSFVDQRYGASLYHARNIWPHFQAFWLRPQDVGDFNGYTEEALREMATKNAYRRVTPRLIRVDRATPLEDGKGILYDVNVEFQADDLRLDTNELLRSQRYALRLRFTLGTPFGETDKDRLELWGRYNGLHFVLVDRYEAVPITVQEAGTPVAGPDSGGVGMTPSAVELPAPPPSGAGNQ